MKSSQRRKNSMAGSGRTLSRRSVLKFGLGMAGSAALGVSLAACVSDRDDADAPAAEPDDDSGDDEIASELEADDAAGEVAAASDDDADDRHDDQPDDFDVDLLIEEWHEEYEMIDIPELDLDNPEVEIQGETYDVWSYDNTWVGEVTDDLFIAFSIEEGYSGVPRKYPLTLVPAGTLLCTLPGSWRTVKRTWMTA